MTDHTPAPHPPSTSSPRLAVKTPWGWSISTNIQGLMQVAAIGILIGIGAFLRTMWDDFTGSFDAMQATIESNEAKHAEQISTLERAIGDMNPKETLDAHANRLEILETVVFANLAPTKPAPKRVRSAADASSR